MLEARGVRHQPRVLRRCPLDHEATYDDWTVLLGDWFLRNDPGEPFMLYVDATVLSELTGWPPDSARTSLVDAVSSAKGLAEGPSFFEPVRVRTHIWAVRDSRAAGYPPYLPVLAMSVLVAAEMPDTNYYEPFRRLLHLMPFNAGMPRGFDATVATWWRDFLQWVNEYLDEELGQLVSRPNRNWPNIGHPRAQAIWKRSDAAKLVPLLTGWPAPVVDDDTLLLQNIRDWAAQHPGRLSDRAHRTIADDEYAGVVIDSVRQMRDADRNRDAAARRRRVRREINSSRLSIWVRENPRTRSNEVRLVGVRPPSWPPELELSDPFGSRVTAKPFPRDSGKYVIDLEVGPRELNLGTMLDGARHQLRLVEQEVYLLAKDSVGGWQQVRRIQAGEPFGALLPAHYLGELRTWIARGFSMSTATPLPEPMGDGSWYLYLGVSKEAGTPLPGFLQASTQEAPDEALDTVGGLRAARRSRAYLVGEAPDILPRGVRRDEAAVSLRINSQEVSVPLVDGRAQLNTTLRNPGRYDILHGDRALGLVLTHAEAPEASLAESLFDCAAIDGRPEPQRLFLRRGRQAKYRRTPAVYWLFGDPGQFLEVTEDDDAWLRRAANETITRTFEVRPPFTVRWAVRTGTPPVVTQHGAFDVTTVPPVPGSAMAHHEWTQRIRSIARQTPVVADDLATAWNEYVSLAGRGT